MEGACQSRQQDGQIKQHTVHTAVVQLLKGSSLTSLFGDTGALCLLAFPQIAFSLSSLLVESGNSQRRQVDSALLATPSLDGALCKAAKACFYSHAEFSRT